MDTNTCEILMIVDCRLLTGFYERSILFLWLSC